MPPMENTTARYHAAHSGFLGVRIKHDRKSLMIVPVRTGQFHPPDGATAIQRTL